MLNDPYRLPMIPERMAEVIRQDPGLLSRPDELNRIRDQFIREVAFPSVAQVNQQIQSVVWRQEHR
jgi:hypothetical protein